MSTAIAAARAKTRGKRMLREALEGYGEDEFTLSEWNAKKKLAVEQGKWTWKQSVADKTQAIKARFEKSGGVQDTIKERFIDVSVAMEQEMHGNSTSKPIQLGSIKVGNAPDCCEWRERVGGKHYRCTNVPFNVKQAQTSGVQSDKPASKHFCLWHARECQYKHHSLEVSRVIETPNEFGFCLTCYEATAATERKTLQRSPPRVVAIQIPGVCQSDEKTIVRRELLHKNPTGGLGTHERLTTRLTASSICCWQQEHFEVAYVWRCSNYVLMHPTLKGSFLPFCGFHTQRCIRDYGRKRNNEEYCPPIARRNTFGMCRNHLEAHLSEMNFEARGTVVLVDSEFDAPGVKECKKVEFAPPVTRHPLAPKQPPPGSTNCTSNTYLGTVVLMPEQPKTVLASITVALSRFAAAAAHLAILILSQATIALLNHSNPVSSFVKEAIWRFQFLRRASVVATRIQRIFRGNRARRRARCLRFERAAVRRIAATRIIQRVVRGFIGRRRFVHELERVEAAIPNIQRILRGGLARLRYRRLRAALLLQRNYRWHRQRVFAWSIREEVAYMAKLQKEADENLRTLEQQLTAFRRIRARRVLRSRIQRWRQEKDARKREAALRIQMLLAAIKVQRKWRSHRRYMEIKKRYTSAQLVQKRVRGWLTRHMWREDPGILVVVGFVNSFSGFEYGTTILLPLSTHSYSVPTRRIRMSCAALVIQRMFRGHHGRLRANATWAAMLKRWEWIGITPNNSDPAGSGSGSGSNDSMSIGRDRYGILLPSFSYHRDTREHMRPVIREPVVNRGHAYKYQYILDLIKDRDGKRAWSMERERKWQHANGRVQAKSSASPTESSSSNGSSSLSKLSVAGMTPIEKTLFPCGTIVDVVQLSRIDAVTKRAMEIDFSRDYSRPKLRRGKVIRVNIPASIEEKSTIDIEYIQSGKVERCVALNRVSHAVFGIDKPLPKPKKPVGEIIQAAIERLKFELQEKERFFVPLPESKEPGQDTEDAFPSVAAIAQRLVDTRKDRDLLADQAKFVDFVFRNSSLLELKWVDVVDLVRRSDLDHEAHLTQTISSTDVQHPALRMLSQEFGLLGHPARVKHRIASTTMKERADEIERRMIALGFKRGLLSRSFNENSIDQRDQESKSFQRERPISSGGTLRSGSKVSSSVPKTRDDIEALHLSKGLSAQALNSLIYELKALPWQRKRERIIHVTTRNARSFICGHAACGQCFSSKEAARTHQKTTHEGKPRLGYAAPLVDQYLHRFWPAQTPWTDHDKPNAPMIGYYPCSQPQCTREFRTRRELHRHLENDHSITLSSPPRPVQLVNSIGASRKVEQLVAIWLGSFTMFRSLGERLDVPWSRFETCSDHGVARNDTCESCQVLQLLPSSPCRCYESVALSTSREVSKKGSQERLNQEEPDDEEFTIISTLDEDFGVAIDADTAVLIRARDGIAMRMEKGSNGRWINNSNPRCRRHTKLLASSDDKHLKVMFMRTQALCRDARNEGWVAGHPFIPANLQKTKVNVDGESSHWTFAADESAEIGVILDFSRVVVGRLKSVVGLTRVQYAAQPTTAINGHPDVRFHGESTDSRVLGNRDYRDDPSNAIRSWRRFDLRRYNDDN